MAVKTDGDNKGSQLEALTGTQGQVDNTGGHGGSHDKHQHRQKNTRE